MSVVYKATPLTDEEESLLEKSSSLHARGRCARFGPWFLPSAIDLAAIKSMEVFPDDVWIVTPPKCGTTWMQEILWLLLNDVDTTTASNVNQFYRAPFIELQYLFDAASEEPYPETLELTEENVRTFMMHSLELAQRVPRPRIIKSHLAFEMLPDNLLDTCKVIFVSRNLKDACVSLYYHEKLIAKDRARRKGSVEEIEGMNFKTFANLFKRALVYPAPFPKQIREAWDLRQHPNMLFVTYEDMKKDIDPVIRKMMNFLEVDLDKSKLQKLKAAVDIDSFRKNTAVNKNKEIPPDGKGGSFIRKGMVGDWKNHFDKELSEEWDKWIEEEFRGSGMEMIFELPQ